MDDDATVWPDIPFADWSETVIRTNSISRISLPTGTGDVPSPRAVMYSETCQPHLIARTSRGEERALEPQSVRHCRIAQADFLRSALAPPKTKKRPGH
jgi:hypothetical protein